MSVTPIGKPKQPDRNMSENNAGRRSFLDWMSDIFSGEPTDRAELLNSLRDAADRQLIDGEALNIIFGALQVSDMRARDIMIPRTQLVYLRDDQPPEELLRTIIDSQHSRFPVIGDDLDDIRGILHAKDLLRLAIERDGEFRYQGLDPSRSRHTREQAPQHTAAGIPFDEESHGRGGG